jgi:hypothetical protein
LGAILAPHGAAVHQEHLLLERADNDKLRHLLAKGKNNCVHCGLAAKHIPRCERGFPGYARMDDLMEKDRTETENERDRLQLSLAEPRVNVRKTHDALKQAQLSLRQAFELTVVPEPYVHE